MTRARTPRPHEVDDARRDERLLRALREGGRDPAWRTRGACQSVDPEVFFPAPSEPADAAVELCRSCPVQGSCLAWALEVGDLHGVWGGTTARERRAMAVVWRNCEHRPASPGTAPLVGVGGGAGLDRLPAPRSAGLSAAKLSSADRASPDRASAELATADRASAELVPAELPAVGPAMDRAELLRLVRAS